MEKMTIAEIISATNGRLLSGNTAGEVNSVCIDSRKMVKGSLFIPIIGESFDGHDFIKEAFDNGAVVSLVQMEHCKFDMLPGALIEVDSTLDAFQNLAKYYRNKFKIPVIGVSGSVGKTTTKEMIAAALGKTLNVLKTEGNYNGQIGLPLTVFRLDSTYDVAVFEMGISKIGEMDRLADIANVDFGVITNVGLSHIENFIDINTTCSEKMKLIKKENGVLFLNGDSPALLKNSKMLDKKVIYFGINGSYDYKCEDVCFGKGEMKFTLITKSFKENMVIPCLGMHNVYNALASIAVASELGLHFEDIKKGLSEFKNVGMRQQISDMGEIILIDDSYNASPDSVKSSVKILKNIDAPGKNILVIADMLELGDMSKEIHFDTGRYIALEGIDLLVTVGEYAKYLSEGAKSINTALQAIHCTDNLEVFEKLKEFLRKGDKVLVKGSRGMHTDEICKMLKEYYV